MDEENEWDLIINVDVVEGSIEKVTVEEMMTALRKMKSGKATGQSEVDSEMIIAFGDTGIKVMVELRQRVLDGLNAVQFQKKLYFPIFHPKAKS